MVQHSRADPVSFRIRRNCRQRLLLHQVSPALSAEEFNRPVCLLSMGFGFIDHHYSDCSGMTSFDMYRLRKQYLFIPKKTAHCLSMPGTRLVDDLFSEFKSYKKMGWSFYTLRP
jgi:hypothetical protein